jgi:hypothetical protein
MRVEEEHNAMTTYELVRSAAIAAAAAAGFCSLSAQAETTGAPASAYRTVHAAESKSPQLCESTPNHIFVATSSGSECVAFWVTKGFEDRAQAVFFMGGDYDVTKFNDPSFAKTNIAIQMALMQRDANKYRVRYVKIARPGIEGSSGNHGDRRKPHELIVMNEAITILKKRLGIKTIALVGQSGGSDLAAGLLTLGRIDIACDMLGSGGLKMVDRSYAWLLQNGQRASKAQLAKAMYDPSGHIDFIAKDPGRRVFVIGDPKDQAVPFEYQWPFADSLRAAGHHALTIKVDISSDPLHHNATTYAWPAAGACLDGASDDEIVSTISDLEDKVRAVSKRVAMQQSAARKE